MTATKAKSDEGTDLLAVRSILFLPASRASAVAKARGLPADLVVLDLEDAVRPEDKESARAAAIDALNATWPMPVAIRVNGIGTAWHSLDLDAVARSKANFAVLPRATSGRLMRGVADAVGKPMLAMVETAAGVLAAAEIARDCAGLIAGTNDLRADLRLPLDASREPLATSLQLIVLAARAAGVAAFDGVFNKFQDLDGFTQEAEEGRRLGFDGKTLIHPDQIGPCNVAFAPTKAEIERAAALVDAFQGGAERFGSEMIERMHVEAAQRVLERSGGAG